MKMDATSGLSHDAPRFLPSKPFGVTNSGFRVRVQGVGDIPGHVSCFCPQNLCGVGSSSWFELQSLGFGAEVFSQDAPRFLPSTPPAKRVWITLRKRW